MMSRSPEVPPVPERPSSGPKEVIAQMQRNMQGLDECRALIEKLPKNVQQAEGKKVEVIEKNAERKKEELQERLEQEVQAELAA
jgi:hypothetical protein